MNEAKTKPYHCLILSPDRIAAGDEVPGPYALITKSMPHAFNVDLENVIDHMIRSTDGLFMEKAICREGLGLLLVQNDLHGRTIRIQIIDEEFVLFQMSKAGHMEAK